MSGKTEKLQQVLLMACPLLPASAPPAFDAFPHSWLLPLPPTWPPGPTSSFLLFPWPVHMQEKVEMTEVRAEGLVVDRWSYKPKKGSSEIQAAGRHQPAGGGILRMGLSLHCPLPPVTPL